jgi:methionyl-tRNA formyltransferase
VNTPFQQIIVIGTGRVASACLECVLGYTKNVTAIEPEQQNFSAVRSICTKAGIDYHFLDSKEALEKFFCAVDTRTLVISAHNSYLFSKTVLQNAHLVIVNFHNSLLPLHKGRNAPAWAIFEMDQKAGITWHRISPEVDAGEIIVQRACEITPTTTALSLTQQCVELGIAAFKELFPQLLANNFTSVPQDCSVAGKLHLSREVPNDGWLDLAWPWAKQSAFLRATDYGKLAIFPPRKLRLLGRAWVVRDYKITANEPGAPDTARVAFTPGALTVSEGSGVIAMTLNESAPDAGA